MSWSDQTVNNFLIFVIQVTIIKDVNMNLVSFYGSKSILGPCRLIKQSLKWRTKRYEEASESP